MALSRTSSLNFANTALLERHLGAISRDVAVLKKSLKRMEESSNSCAMDGTCRCALLSADFTDAAKRVNSIENEVNLAHAVQTQLAGYGSAVPHVQTFYRSAAGSSVEVAPVPEFRSAEAFNPSSSSLIANSALKMMKSPKKKLRQRDRKSKKTRAPFQIVKIVDNGKIPDDGFCWRKYGSKNIKTAVYKKAYYRCNAPCALNKSKKCRAKKTVQQANNDPTILHVSYDARHSCKSEMNATPSAEDQGNRDSLNLAEQMQSNEAAAALRSPDPAGNWEIPGPVDDFTSSGTFSAITDAELEVETDALVNLPEVDNGSADFRDLMETTGWPASALEADNQIAKSPYVPEDDPNQLLIGHIIQGGGTSGFEEQDDPILNYMSLVRDWHHNWHDN